VGVHCIALRPETEWIETVEAGWSAVVGSDVSLILEKARTVQPPPQSQRHIFGDGHTSELIIHALESNAAARRTGKSV